MTVQTGVKGEAAADLGEQVCQFVLTVRDEPVSSTRFDQFDMRWKSVNPEQLYLFFNHFITVTAIWQSSVPRKQSGAFSSMQSAVDAHIRAEILPVYLLRCCRDDSNSHMGIRTSALTSCSIQETRQEQSKFSCIWTRFKPTTWAATWWFIRSTQFYNHSGNNDPLMKINQKIYSNPTNQTQQKWLRLGYWLEYKSRFWHKLLLLAQTSGRDGTASYQSRNNKKVPVVTMATDEGWHLRQRNWGRKDKKEGKGGREESPSSALLFSPCALINI